MIINNKSPAVARDAACLFLYPMSYRLLFALVQVPKVKAVIAPAWLTWGWTWTSAASDVRSYVLYDYKFVVPRTLYYLFS